MEVGRCGVQPPTSLALASSQPGELWALSLASTLVSLDSCSILMPPPFLNRVVYHLASSRSSCVALQWNLGLFLSAVLGGSFSYTLLTCLYHHTFVNVDNLALKRSIIEQDSLHLLSV
jgi:hypothetical protein